MGSNPDSVHYCEDLFHINENPSDGEVDVKHKKRLDLFCNLIETFTRYSTACSCALYWEVELLRTLAHIRLRKPSPRFCTLGVPNFHFCEYFLNLAFKYLFGVTNILISSLKWLVTFT